MKKSLLITMSVVLALLSIQATLQNIEARAEYPDRTITLLVGFAPGGHMSLSARALATSLSKILGQPVVVENKAGGTGTVALASLIAAKPDGYTLCATPTSVLIRVSQLHKVPFKPLSSFNMLIGYAAPQLGIVVKKDAPWKTLKDLTEDAKAHPGKIKYATVGVGSTLQAAVDEISAAEKLQVIHVPFKGSAPVIAAVLGGHVDFASMTSEFAPTVKSGQTRLLAVMTEKRIAAFPDVPTFQELGYNFVNDTVFALAAPADLPSDVSAKLQAALALAVQSKEYREAIEKLDMIPLQISSADMDVFLKTHWKTINRHLIKTGLIKEAATSPE